MVIVVSVLYSLPALFAVHSDNVSRHSHNLSLRALAIAAEQVGADKLSLFSSSADATGRVFAFHFFITSWFIFGSLVIGRSRLVVPVLLGYAELDRKMHTLSSRHSCAMNC